MRSTVKAVSKTLNKVKTNIKFISKKSLIAA
jgi:hypothetical protein